jgi:hypothetical protein
VSFKGTTRQREFTHLSLVTPLRLKKTIISLSYSIKSANSDFLKNWKLEGSSDFLNWEVLDERKDETSLCSTNAIATFNCQSPKQFSIFRLIQNGKNSNGSDNFQISRFSFFGSIIDVAPRLGNMNCNVISSVISKYGNNQIQVLASSVSKLNIHK